MSRIQRQLASDGALVLGAAETIIGLTTNLRANRDTPGIYRMNGAPSEFASVA
jgi:chemotaxis methyl-accepting protein methylase